jgi:hypothetical protein
MKKNEIQVEDNDVGECEININDLENEEWIELMQDETNNNSLVEDDNGDNFDYNDCEQESDYINTQQRSEKSDHDSSSDTMSARYDTYSDVPKKTKTMTMIVKLVINIIVMKVLEML